MASPREVIESLLNRVFALDKRVDAMAGRYFAKQDPDLVDEPYSWFVFEKGGSQFGAVNKAFKTKAEAEAKAAEMNKRG